MLLKALGRCFGESLSTLLLGLESPGAYVALRFALGEVTERGHQTTEDQTRRELRQAPDCLPGAPSCRLCRNSDSRVNRRGLSVLAVNRMYGCPPMSSRAEYCGRRGAEAQQRPT
jgi:hypothetical protein